MSKIYIFNNYGVMGHLFSKSKHLGLMINGKHNLRWFNEMKMEDLLTISDVNKSYKISYEQFAKAIVPYLNEIRMV